ncbi:MAG: cupin domain-containing protein [Rhodospirillales bacterium]|nr:cupin domain-containing protein [Rhodospirillales bacterium]
MRINANFDERALLQTNSADWVASPSAGVDRIMLDRLGGEVARATSIVRFAAGSTFPMHRHDGGEEFLVLDGTFSDGSGDFGPGSYLRHPVGTSHTPFTREGCSIFVKLWQFQDGDTESVTIDTRAVAFAPGLVDGLSVLPLHQFETESTALVRWQPGTVFNRHSHFGGEEIYVIEGTFEDEFGAYPAGTWLRSPHLSSHTPFSGEGCLIYVKAGHLLAELGTLSDPAERSQPAAG